MDQVIEALKEASSYKEKGKFENAVRILESLLETIPDDWRVWTELGHCLLGKGDHKESLAAFEKAIELEPEKAGLWSNKGYVLREMSDLPGAIEATRRAKSYAKTSQDEKMAHYNLACYHSLSGKTEQALEHLSKACSDDSQIKEWAKQDSDLDPIRSHPRFTEIMKDMF